MIKKREGISDTPNKFSNELIGLWKDAKERLIASGGETEAVAISKAIEEGVGKDMSALSPEGAYFLFLSKERMRLGEDNSFLGSEEATDVAKGMPFRAPLQESVFGRGLQELKEDPSKIIRKISLDDLALNFGEHRPGGISDKEWREKTITLAIKAKRLYDELEERYDIKIAKKVVIGYDEQETPVVYVITKKINGYDLSKEQNFPSELQEDVSDALGKLYISWLQYFSDKYESGDFFAWDIAKNWQYIFGEVAQQAKIYPAGTADSRANNNLFLVDTDFRYVAKNKERIFSCLSRVAVSVEEMEIKLGIKFVKVRSRFNVLLNNLSVEEKNQFHGYLESVEQFLGT